MNELAKVNRIIEREVPTAPHEVLLVLDATTGQNALNQAKTFSEVTDVSGIVLTKLDGTAKGGIVLAIRNELTIPVRSEEHTSELQSRGHLVCRLLLEKKKIKLNMYIIT